MEYRDLKGADLTREGIRGYEVGAFLLGFTKKSSLGVRGFPVEAVGLEWVLLLWQGQHSSLNPVFAVSWLAQSLSLTRNLSHLSC